MDGSEVKGGSRGGDLEGEIDGLGRNCGLRRRFWGFVLGLEGERNEEISGFERRGRSVIRREKRDSGGEQGEKAAAPVAG